MELLSSRCCAGCAVVCNDVVDGVEREIPTQHLIHDPLRLESNDPAAGVNEPTERHREDTDIRATSKTVIPGRVSC